ncbi:MAG: polyprenyl synthetase family protein [Polyangiaceae bacterium]
MSQAALDLSHKSPLAEFLDEHFTREELAHTLGTAAADVPWACWSDALYEPLAEFLGRPGKEFRARLVQAAFTIGGGREMAPELPAIIEAIHAGSLIIDDIEDDSAYRRGAPALHVRYGMARALNAGSLLYFWPHELLGRIQLHATVELAIRRAIDRTLFAAHHGQALDLSVRVTSLGQAEVEKVVSTTTRLKTGALVGLAAEIGALAAGAPAEVTRSLARFGQALGVGLQMADDWGGLASESRCHKGHEDLLLSRPTWPWAWAAQRLEPAAYARLLAQAQKVHDHELHPEHVSEALRDTLTRYAPAVIHQTLTRATRELAHVVGPSAALTDLEAQVRVLEASYV